VEIDTIICGDVMEVLSTLPDRLVQTVITSPPYFSLRDYGIDGQLGLEPTPEEYVEKMVAIFREVRRVLRDDGTVWLNLGDSYASNGIYIHSWYDKEHNKEKEHLHTKNRDKYKDKPAFRGGEYGIKAKDLIGIPWRCAFALQTDGWYLRSDIIWSKPNPMPESVTDRPTKAHEYLFLLTKSARYYYDQEAVREPVTGNSNTASKEVSDKRPNRNFPGQAQRHHCGGEESGARNRRTVWTIATEPYPEAHFATFPQALVDPCLLAGTSEYGCCPECGAPWERVVERNIPNKTMRDGEWENDARVMGIIGTEGRGGRMRVGLDRKTSDEKNPGYKTLGWQPTCSCACNKLGPGRDAPAAAPEYRWQGVEPCIVLDPFMGSGTTALVAIKHRRHYLGIELNPEYVELANRRLREVQVKLL